MNSLDYPAMYEGVIGSGYDERISYKEGDIKYDKNKVVIVPRLYEVYEGNSYLSPLAMMYK